MKLPLIFSQNPHMTSQMTCATIEEAKSSYVEYRNPFVG